jgi:hypothetical protein
VKDLVGIKKQGKVVEKKLEVVEEKDINKVGDKTNIDDKININDKSNFEELNNGGRKDVIGKDAKNERKRFKY